MVFSRTAFTASGRPLSPSQASMHTSRTPRFLVSGKTRSQYLAPSPSPCSPARRPGTSRPPSAVTPSARQTGRPAARPSRIFTLTASMKITAYTEPSGRLCHSARPSMTRPAMAVIACFETSAP